MRVMIETDKLAAERIIAATPVSPNEEAFERALRYTRAFSLD